MRKLVAIIFLAGIVTLAGCRDHQPAEKYRRVNFSHLKYLTHDKVIKNTPVNLIWIYSEFPDYRLVEAPAEGIACVDDVARAAVLYLMDYRYTGNESSLQSARPLLNFILAMQAGNGLFYNFIYSDLTINTTHKNSQARADWWSWRATWALAEGLEAYHLIDPDYSAQLSESITRVFPAIDSLLGYYPGMQTVEGISIPAWLPSGAAADQAGVIILGLLPYYRVTGEPIVREYIQKLAQGILAMQFGDSLTFPFSAFLSWENTWHAYGNIQSYALLSAGEVLSDPILIEKALREVDHFYPFLMKEQYLCAFSVKKSGEEILLMREDQFPQIAYGIRPMVWACLKAYQLTGLEKYASLAGRISRWLFGENLARQSMYDRENGRCFDGLNSEESVNRNCGAESTIEALLTLIMLEQHPAAMEALHRNDPETGQ